MVFSGETGGKYFIGGYCEIRERDEIKRNIVLFLLSYNIKIST